MELNLQRFEHLSDTTIGRVYIGSEAQCYTLEDEYREVKVKHHTRIPDGSYEIKLRTVGGFNSRYSKRFSFHKGMLELQDVPGFKYILIHCGNSEKDTSGCILLGKDVKVKVLRDSTGAYKDLYPKIIEAMNDGEIITINIQSVNMN